MLYVICRYARDDISQEVQGLERERSRAQAEKDEQELQILTEVGLVGRKLMEHDGYQNILESPSSKLESCDSPLAGFTLKCADLACICENGANSMLSYCRLSRPSIAKQQQQMLPHANHNHL